jgi:hypothetical protein
MSEIHSWLPLTIIKFPIKIGEGLNGFLQNNIELEFHTCFQIQKMQNFK